MSEIEQNLCQGLNILSNSGHGFAATWTRGTNQPRRSSG